MNKIVDILATYSDPYFRDHYVPAWTKTCVSRIIACEQKQLGDVINVCLDCGQTFLADCTCKSKNCPSCGFKQTYDWLNKATDTFPTMPYQHLVFTVPMFLRPFFTYNFKLMVHIQFAAVSASLRHFTKSKGLLSFWLGVIQFCGVLLNQNPHIHVVAPCGGLLFDESDYKEFCYYHAKTLSKSYTAFFLKKLRGAYKQGKLKLPPQYAHLDTYKKFTYFINDQVTTIKIKRNFNSEPSPHAHFIEDVCPDVSNPRYRSWCVYAAPIRKQWSPFAYIVRYLHHPPISQHKIIQTRRDRIVIRAKHPTTGLQENFRFTPDEFMKRFLATFPPKGFHAVRRGGLLAPAHKAKFQKLKSLLKDRYPKMVPVKDDIKSQMHNYKIKERPKTCECGGKIVFFTRLRPNHWIYDYYTKQELKELSCHELKNILDTS